MLLWKILTSLKVNCGVMVVNGNTRTDIDQVKANVRKVQGGLSTWSFDEIMVQKYSERSEKRVN